MNARSGAIDSKLAAKIIVVSAAVVAAVAILMLDTTGQSGSGLGDAYTYNIAELAKIDPSLIIYSETAAEFETGFSAAQAIVTDSQGRIHVAGDKGVRVFDATGDLVSELSLTGEPRSLAVGDDGRTYVAVRDHIEVYDGSGKQLGTWESLGEKAVLTSIAVGKEDVFVADAGNRIVLRYDKDGSIVGRIGKRDAERNIPGFVIPSPYFDLLIARDGLLRVVNPGMHRIEAYTFNGDLEFWWGEFSASLEGFVGCCNPINLAILSNDSFVTCEKGLVRVKVFDVEGEFVGAVAGPEQLIPGKVPQICNLPEQCQAGGFDIAVDVQDRVYVLDTARNVVRTYSKDEAE